MQKTLKTPNSARPEALSGPVPDVATPELASQMPPMAAVPGLPSGPTDAELEAEYDQIIGEFTVPESEIQEDQPYGTFAGNFSQQFSEAPTRARASFAVTDKEKRQVLEEKFGKENVKHANDVFYVKRPGAKKFSKFDSDAFEIIGDIADFAREGVEEAVALPFEIAGAAKGAVTGLAGGPAAPATVPAGAIVGTGLGRAAGAAAGTNVADAVAQNLLDIERDPSRSRLLETGLAATLTTFFGAAGDKLGSTIARKQAAKRLAIPEHEALSETSKEILSNTRELRDLGKLEVGPDGKVALLPHQVDPSNPKAVAWAKEVSALPAFGKLLNQQADAADKLIKDTLHEGASLSGKGLLNDAQLAEQTKNIASEVRKAEGKAIEGFRNKANQKLMGTAKHLPAEALTTIYELTGRMGFSPKELRSTAPTKEVLDNIQGTMGISNAGEARFFFNQMKQVADRLQRGQGMSFDDLSSAITILDKGTKQARRAGGEVSALYGKLSSGLREARNNLVRENLPKSELPAFEASMTRFKNTLSAQENLGSLLDEDIANKAFVNQVFSEGTKGLSRLKAAKTVLAEEHPQVWDTLKANYIEQLVVKNSGSVQEKSVGLDAAAIKKSILTMGKEGRDILFDGDPKAIKQMFSALDYGERIKDSSFTRLSPDRQKDIAQGFISALAGGTWVKAKTALEFIGARAGKESKFMEMLTDEGVDSFFGKLPAGQRNRFREVFSGMQDIYRNGMIRGTSPKSVAPVRRTLRSTVRDKAREAQYESEPNEDLQ